jgi:hypothetical protein
MVTNNRKHRRQAIEHTGRIIVAPDTPPLLCILRDVSQTGARLELSAAEQLPDEFVLGLTEAMEPRRQCQVVWRKPEVVGVRFVPLPSADDDSVFK